MRSYNIDAKLEVITKDDVFLISNHKKIKFCINHNSNTKYLKKYHLVMAKFIEGNFSVVVEDVFLQTFNGSYFFFLYANSDYSEYILDFSCTSYVLNKKNSN